MCAHYTLFTDEQIQEIHEIVREVERITGQPQQLEMFPKMQGPVLLPDESRNLQVAAMTWGYPERFKSKKTGKLLVPKYVQNTRVETARSNGFWHDSYTQRRCLIPAVGFDEWRHNEDNTKTLYTFFVPGAIMYIAGIYKYKDGQPYYSMLTTKPNGQVADIHDRMPLVLADDDLEQWLHGDYDALADCSHINLLCKPTAMPK